MTQINSLVVCNTVTNTKIGSTGGFGIQTSQANTLVVTPLTKNATALAASQSVAGAGALTLTAGTSVTTVVDAYGTVRYVLDCVRSVTITSAGNDSGITFTVSGFDPYGAAMTATVTGANVGVATTLKAFASVTSVTASAAAASTVTVGTADVFGMPIAVVDKGYLSGIGWNNTLGYDAGTFVVADQTSPATSLTGDVRGTYAPSSASNGTKLLVIEINISPAQATQSSTTTAILGVTQA